MSKGEPENKTKRALQQWNPQGKTKDMKIKHNLEKKNNRKRT